MSNTGLNSNIYYSTRSYLDLLNNYLIDLNYSKAVGKDYKNRDVVSFFKRILEKSNIDPETRMIRSFFSSYYREHQKDTEKELLHITTELQKTEPDASAIKEIEELVDVLKFQCAESYARMKGNK